MLALAALLLAANLPLPPPSPDRYAAAIRLWEARAPSEAEQQAAIDNAVSQTVRAALTQVGVRAGRRGWQEKHDLLVQRLSSRVPQHRAAIVSGVAHCAALILGHRLAAEDLDAARRFMATAEGARVWAALRIAEDVSAHCYNERVSTSIPVTPEDYRAARLRPPRYRYGIVT
jgi:hypothetical protein